MNYKKELNLVVAKTKKSPWFNLLDGKEKEYVLQEIKDWHTPPDIWQNTIMNIFIGKKWQEWVDYAKTIFPFYDGGLGNSEINLAKRQYVSNLLFKL